MKQTMKPKQFQVTEHWHASAYLHEPISGLNTSTTEYPVFVIILFTKRSRPCSFWMLCSRFQCCFSASVQRQRERQLISSFTGSRKNHHDHSKSTPNSGTAVLMPWFYAVHWFEQISSLMKAPSKESAELFLNKRNISSMIYEIMLMKWTVLHFYVTLWLIKVFLLKIHLAWFWSFKSIMFHTNVTSSQKEVMECQCALKK